MRIEKIFAIRLKDDSLSEVTFVYDFDDEKLYCEYLDKQSCNDIDAIRICTDCGLNEWNYNVDPKEIKRIMLRDHNKESNKAHSDMNDRRSGPHEEYY